MAGPFVDMGEDEGEDGNGAGGELAVTIAADAPPRLDKALAAAVPEDAALSRSRLMKMIAEGAVQRDGVAITDPRARVRAGEVYVLLLAPAVEIAAQPEDIALAVVWEDADLIVIDKPAGMVVHPAPGTPSGTLVNALLHHCGDTCRGSAARGGPASSTASTRILPAFWWWRNPTGRITGWPPSSRRIR